MSAESLHSPENYDPWKFYPNPEDWDALQGGKPRVFHNPHRSAARWIVLHVYDEHAVANQRFKNGNVVETLPPDPSDIPMSRIPIRRYNEDGTLVERDIIIPSLMRLDVHGGPCESRSSAVGGGRYRRIKNQAAYEDIMQDLWQQGMEELKYGVQENALKLIPMGEIRQPRPLDN